MSALVTDKLQAAVFALLASDETLTLKTKGIFDMPPVGSGFPVVSLGETSVTASPVKDREGVTVNFSVSLWSSQHSQMEVKELIADADRVLGGRTLDVIGFDCLPIRLLNASVIRQLSATDILHKGQLNYTVQLFENG